MHFTKMNGTGNDFVILDEMDRPLGVAPEDIPALVYRLCSRHTGVGADGVILLQRPRGDAACRRSPTAPTIPRAPSRRSVCARRILRA